MPKGSTKQAMETLLEQHARQWCPTVELCLRAARLAEPHFRHGSVVHFAHNCAHFDEDSAACEWRQLLEATKSPSAMAEILR